MSTGLIGYDLVTFGRVLVENVSCVAFNIDVDRVIDVDDNIWCSFGRGCRRSGIKM